MSLPSKVRKAKNADSSQATKTKPDNKQETLKQLDKAQPTAEQMRIAQIIDTKTEDPALKEKLKQVMDATQKSIDDAYTALHDCDNDPNLAVNLLLEGIESEWSTSSKKKKNRISSDKSSKDKDLPPEAPVEEENWDAVPNSKLSVGSKTGNIRGRGRGGRISNSQNSDTNDRVKRPVKVPNGPVRGRGTRGRPQSRGYGRGRASFRRPIDTWDPQRSVSSNLNHDNSDDWDNEEYTGSLANSQIYTSSGSGNSPPSVISSLLLGSNSVATDDFDQKNQLQVDITSGKIGNILNKSSECNSLSIPFPLKPYGTHPEPVLTSPVGVRSPTMGSNLIMISPRADRAPMLMTSQQKEDSKISEKAITPPMGVRSPPIATNLIMMTRTDRASINSQEMRMHRPRPKIPPPSKIPATAVEMPPDTVENHIGFLDVSFGALELSESSDAVQVSPPVPRHSPSPVTSEKLLAHQTGATSDSLLLNEASFSPVRNNVAAASISQISDLTSKVPDVTSSLYQEPTYQPSPYSKTAQQSPSVYSSTYSSGQITSTSSIIYSTSSSQSTYSSSTGGVYGGISSSYPQYQYNSYPSQQTQTLPMLTNSSNSYQSVLGSQQYGSSSQSVYGTSGLPTPSYTTPYQTYNSSVQHNHKQALVSSTSSSSKEFETSQPSVNLGSITHSGSINPTPTLLSGTQTTQTSKPTSMSSMGKSTVVTNMPPGVPPLVGTHQYIMGQGGIPYFQQAPMYYEDLQLMQQQRLAPHISTGYYEMGYPTSTTREGVQYNMNDGRFARTDNTSPVQASSISQQSGSQAHQQPMMNPTAMPPAYAYFYGGSAMIPGNFQYGAPTLYPVAAGGTSSTHGNTSSGVYGKGPNNFSGNYGGIYENTQGTTTGSSDFKTSTSTGPKVQPTQTANPSTTSDIAANIYSSKSHSALSKSYEKQGFHCATPPPFNIGSQNSGMGPGGGYPQHLFIPAMTPHHNATTLMHQPIHQDGSNTMSGRSQGNQQAKVVMTKAGNYSSTYWPQN